MSQLLELTDTVWCWVLFAVNVLSSQASKVHVEEMQSIADGHIRLSPQLRDIGVQPPVDPQHSLTRIGIGSRKEIRDHRSQVGVDCSVVWCCAMQLQCIVVGLSQPETYAFGAVTTKKESGNSIGIGSGIGVSVGVGVRDHLSRRKTVNQLLPFLLCWIGIRVGIRIRIVFVWSFLWHSFLFLWHTTFALSFALTLDWLCHCQVSLVFLSFFLSFYLCSLVCLSVMCICGWGHTTPQAMQKVATRLRIDMTSCLDAVRLNSSPAEVAHASKQLSAWRAALSQDTLQPVPLHDQVVLLFVAAAYYDHPLIVEALKGGRDSLILRHVRSVSPKLLDDIRDSGDFSIGSAKLLDVSIRLFNATAAVEGTV